MEIAGLRNGVGGREHVDLRVAAADLHASRTAGVDVVAALVRSHWQARSVERVGLRVVVADLHALGVPGIDDIRPGHPQVPQQQPRGGEDFRVLIRTRRSQQLPQPGLPDPGLDLTGVQDPCAVLTPAARRRRTASRNPA